MLLKSDGRASQKLVQFSQADSILLEQFNKFRIADENIRVQAVEVDSQFTRKTYYVAVPPGFSKTQLHAELHRTFYPMDVDMPAEVTFPDEDFRIHLLYDQTIFRSIYLETDSDLTLSRNFASIIIAYDEVPPEDELEAIEQMGEPIALALIVDNPLKANELRSDLAPFFSEAIFWLQDENGNSIPGPNSARESARFTRLQESVPEARVLSFISAEELASKIQNKGKIRLVDVSDALMLNPADGSNIFRQELKKLMQQSQNLQHPVAVVMGSEESVNWLQQELPELKKSGLRIIKPPTMNY